MLKNQAQHNGWQAQRLLADRREELYNMGET